MSEPTPTGNRLAVIGRLGTFRPDLDLVQRTSLVEAVGHLEEHFAAIALSALVRDEDAKALAKALFAPAEPMATVGQRWPTAASEEPWTAAEILHDHDPTRY